jgi:hypothetical protein
MSHQVKTASSIYTLQHRQLSVTYVIVDSQNIRSDLCHQVMCVCECVREGGREGGRGREREGDGRRGRYGDHVLSVYYLWGPGYILVY